MNSVRPELTATEPFFLHSVCFTIDISALRLGTRKERQGLFTTRGLAVVAAPQRRVIRCLGLMGRDRKEKVKNKARDVMLVPSKACVDVVIIEYLCVCIGTDPPYVGHCLIAAVTHIWCLASV